MAIVLNIVPNSENYHTLAGLRDQNGNPIAPAAVQIQISATDKNNSQVLAATVMPSVATNPDGTRTWGVSSAAGTWVLANAPWTIHMIVYDPTGATIYHDFLCMGTASD